MKAQRFTKQQIAEALEKAAGFQTVAAQILKCDRMTIANYLKRYPELAEIHTNVVDTFLDKAELKLQGQIEKGNMAAIIFYLKTKGKTRGYVERVENELSTNSVIHVEIK